LDAEQNSLLDLHKQFSIRLCQQKVNPVKHHEAVQSEVPLTGLVVHILHCCIILLHAISYNHFVSPNSVTFLPSLPRFARSQAIMSSGASTNGYAEPEGDVAG